MATAVGEDTQAFGVELITPMGIALASSTYEVKLPGINGEIGILTRHIPYIGLLGTGIIEFVCAETKSVMRAVVSGGFCSFADDKLSVLADSVDLPEDIDADVYAEERENLINLVNSKHYDDPEVVQAREKLVRIEAIDRLISH